MAQMQPDKSPRGSTSGASLSHRSPETRAQVLDGNASTPKSGSQNAGLIPIAGLKTAGKKTGMTARGIPSLGKKKTKMDLGTIPRKNGKASLGTKDGLRSHGLPIEANLLAQNPLVQSLGETIKKVGSPSGTKVGPTTSPQMMKLPKGQAKAGKRARRAKRAKRSGRIPERPPLAHKRARIAEPFQSLLQKPLLKQQHRDLKPRSGIQETMLVLECHQHTSSQMALAAPSRIQYWTG